MRITEKRGMALFVVMGIIAIFVPLLFFLTQMGGSQIKRAVKFHESLQAESAALSGSNSAYCRLRGNLTGYQSFVDLILGDNKYSLTIRPTGMGVFLQNLYYIFSKCVVGNHNYLLMSDGEQFPPEPTPPVMTIPHDFWSTLEPYDINLLADQTSMENFRGQDLLRLEETREFEGSMKKDQYQKAMELKERSGVPKELRQDWSGIVQNMLTEKM